MTQDRKADTAAHWKSLVRDLRQRNWKSPHWLEQLRQKIFFSMRKGGGKANTLVTFYKLLEKNANCATIYAW